jgi:hypothetical protein
VRCERIRKLKRVEIAIKEKKDLQSGPPTLLKTGFNMRSFLQPQSRRTLLPVNVS